MTRLDDVLEFAALSDRGRVRPNNEDAVLAEPALGLALLADGMGGSNAGAVASGMATALLARALRQALASVTPGEQPRVLDLLREQIAVANRAILAAAEREPRYAGMGTTLLLALFFDNRVAVAHLGDSRLYRLRGDRLAQVTRDHSLLQAQIDRGTMTKEEARHSKYRHIVTRAMGIEPDVEAELHEYLVQPGDVYVLCSDGLYDMVDDDDIARTLERPHPDLQSAAAELVTLANERGGRDNVSVVLVKVRRAFGASKGGSR